MIFQQISNGGTQNFGYYICDEADRVAAFVDPSFAPEKFLVIAEEMEAEVKYIINTHSHDDHANGNSQVLKRTKAKLVGYGVKGKGAIAVKDSAELELGSIALRIIHTPGHTQDSICIQCDHNVITGDTLFVGKVGATEKPADTEKHFESLHKLLELLSDEVDVFPGHDFGVRPFSTIRYEKDNNPFLYTNSLKEFTYLKAYWGKKAPLHV